MGVKGGFGVQLQVDLGSGYGTVGRMFSADIPSPKVELGEAWAHDSIAGYLEKAATGRIDPGAITVMVRYDRTLALHESLLALTFAAPTAAKNWRVYLPNGKAFGFAAFLTQMKKASAPNGIIEAALTIEITGRVTILV